MTVLNGPRLTLRPITHDDEPWLLRHWNQPEVRRYLFDDEPVTDGLVTEIVDESAEDFEKFGYGLWLLFENDRPVGACGLRTIDDGPPELLYSVDPPYWGRGLATESARVVLAYAGPIEVVAETDKANRNSERVLETLGMRFVSERTGPNGILKRFALPAPAKSDA